MGVMGINATQAVYTNTHDPCCPGCSAAKWLCAHILYCPEVDQVDTLHCTIRIFNWWMLDMDTNHGLCWWLLQFANRCGVRTMNYIVASYSNDYLEMAVAQDGIGWCRVVEGMITKELVSIQQNYIITGFWRLLTVAWACDLITRILEVLHSQ